MMKIKKIALVSAFLDEGDEILLDDEYMENFVCKEDHFYHRIAKSLNNSRFRTSYTFTINY